MSDTFVSSIQNSLVALLGPTIQVKQPCSIVRTHDIPLTNYRSFVTAILAAIE